MLKGKWDPRNLKGVPKKTMQEGGGDDLSILKERL